MKTLKLSGQFRKDLKRYKHQPDKLDALELILGYLQRGEAVAGIQAAHALR